MKKAELVVALDVPSSTEIEPIIAALPRAVATYKVGLELFTKEGFTPLRLLADEGKKIFLDLKFHDIPRTVARAVRSASALGVSLLTVHAAGGREMLKAAAGAAAEAGPAAPKLIAVTTLTSLGPEDLADLGISRTVEAQALALGELALTAGIDGLVTSVHEAPALRTRFGATPLLVTPGIRLPDDQAGDQKRVATPAAAVAAGSDFLVVGRSILAAADPAAAARAVLADMARAPRRGRD
ncbi:MAG: orotidine-5'-phosphate decarboxylase [Kiritimatiellae bacterium]|nr:orotidine-5'-phosphate decarboxylase [Kiritimatiellia bacterium]